MLKDKHETKTIGSWRSFYFFLTGNWAISIEKVRHFEIFSGLTYQLFWVHITHISIFFLQDRGPKLFAITIGLYSNCQNMQIQFQQNISHQMLKVCKEWA